MLDITTPRRDTATVALTVPSSICFTPDKNRTWAQSFGLPPILGHTKGRDTARTVINECFRVGVRDVVMWAMSESNIHKRSPSERNHLVALLKEELRSREKKDDEVGFFLCGRWRRVVGDSELEDLVHRAHERTANYHAKRLTILFGYRGMTDILQAGAAVADELGPDAVVNEDLIRKSMWIKHLPAQIDMLVRTGVNSANKHNSDSLLPLHGEQAFVHDTPIMWPEFTVERLHEGFHAFGACPRKKGS